MKHLIQKMIKKTQYQGIQDKKPKRKNLNIIKNNSYNKNQKRKDNLGDKQILEGN